jgi:TPR repeat protein
MRHLMVLLIRVLLGVGLLFPAARADMDSGLMAYANGDFDTAAREFSALAAQGDKEGHYYMGLLYEEGQGVEQSYQAAVNCYRNAAGQGFLDAYFALGEIYLRQPGGKRDRVAAYYWLGMAAKHGHPRGEEEFRRNKRAMTPDEIRLAEQRSRAGF